MDFKFWPITAKTEVFFEMKTSYDSQNAVVKVWDIVGRLIWTQEMFGNRQITWPAGKNAEGLYFYTVEIDGKPLKSGKISLIK